MRSLLGKARCLVAALDAKQRLGRSRDHAHDYPRSTGASITLYHAFCMLVYGLFAFGLYKMHQPRQIANLGLAAYKAPVAAVRGYDPTERVAYIRRTLIEEDASYETFDQRTVASSGSDRLLAVREAGHN